MKKIVALVLSLVMVLGLATTAFGAITLWGENTKTVDCDIFEAAYNTKLNDTTSPVQVTYHPGNALELNLDGTIKKDGVVPYYTFSVPSTYRYYVMVSSVPADADANQYFLVKAHNPAALKGATMVYGQTAADAYYILKGVNEVAYQGEATEFTAWSNDCEAYKAPLDAATVDYYSLAADIKVSAAKTYSDDVKYAVIAWNQFAQGMDYVRVLVDGEVILLNAGKTVKATQHAWLASKWDAKKVPVEYTCNNCKTVGTVVNSPVNAPAGAKLDNFMGTLIAYNFPAVEAAGDKVESAQTFDAGIAMYVGMSVMAAAGSAVVLKKKD